MATFLFIPNIPGEALDKDHKDHIDVEKFSWGLSNPGSALSKKKAPPSFTDLTVQKSVDRATAKLAAAAASGEPIRGEVVLDETRSYTDAGRVTYLRAKLWDALVTEVTLDKVEEEEDVVGEVVSFVFPKIEMVYTLYDFAGKKKGEERFAWDLISGGPF